MFYGEFLRFSLHFIALISQIDGSMAEKQIKTRINNQASGIFPRVEYIHKQRLVTYREIGHAQLCQYMTILTAMYFST